MQKLPIILLFAISSYTLSHTEKFWPEYPEAYPICSKAILPIAQRMSRIIAASPDGVTIVPVGLPGVGSVTLYTIDHYPPYANKVYRPEIDSQKEMSYGNTYTVIGIKKSLYEVTIKGPSTSIQSLKKSRWWWPFESPRVELRKLSYYSNTASYITFFHEIADQKVRLSDEEKINLWNCIVRISDEGTKSNFAKQFAKKFGIEVPKDISEK